MPLSSLHRYNSTRLSSFFSKKKQICLYLLHLVLSLLTPRYTITVFIFILEFSFVVLPLLFAVTIFSELNHVFAPFLVLVSLCCSFSMKPKREILNVELLEEINSARKYFLSAYRSTMVAGLPSFIFSISKFSPNFFSQIKISQNLTSQMLMTIISILAVDFPVFPRKFAKTETFGTGMVIFFKGEIGFQDKSQMDIGVGSFVFSAALVSVKFDPRGRKGRPKGLKEAVVSSSPMFILWFFRIISVKATDYYVIFYSAVHFSCRDNAVSPQEHVSEYGVHWNFFATLGVVSVAGSLFTLEDKRKQFVLACVVATGSFFLAPTSTKIKKYRYEGHQIVLLNPEVRGWMLDGPRDTLFAANREGIVGCVGGRFYPYFFSKSHAGYYVIFLLGQCFGSILGIPKSKPDWLSFLKWSRSFCSFCFRHNFFFFVFLFESVFRGVSLCANLCRLPRGQVGVAEWIPVAVYHPDQRISAANIAPAGSPCTPCMLSLKYFR